MILRIIIVALRNLLRQPFRTMLILQGVIWGTALGVVPPAVINGSLRLVEENATKLGTDRLLLTQDHIEAPSKFDWALLEQLRELHGEEIKHATAMAVLPDENDQSPKLIATDEQALAARGLKLRAGRFFSAAEVAGAKSVCVLEDHAATKLFGDSDPIGRRVQLPGCGETEVVGVTSPRAAEGQSLDEMGYQKDHPMRKLVEMMKREIGVFQDDEVADLNDDSAVMIPRTLVAGLQPRWIELRADPKQVLALRDKIQNRLAADGYEPVIYANAILPLLYGETIKTAMELHRAVFVLCILVGTSVVCSIMVLSVVERQREIAIRRVEGARRWHIALQFVVETGTLCAVGATAGIPLGILIAIIRCALEPLGSVTWAFPGPEVCLIVAVVTAIGLAGGFLPAWRAMRVDPVEMLRYE